jgi:hypothetical protein
MQRECPRRQWEVRFVFQRSFLKNYYHIITAVVGSEAALSQELRADFSVDKFKQTVFQQFPKRFR